MLSFYQSALAKFKKANKSRRVKIYKDAGFASAEQYKQFLELQIAAVLVTPPKPATSTTGDSEKPLDIVFAIDSTGSMADYRKGTRNKVAQFVNELFKDNENVRASIVVFGDYCDPKSIRYQFIQLTDEKEKLIRFVENSRNTGGGDGDEFYELVLKKVYEETHWRSDSKRVLVLIGDAPPHKVGYTYGKIIKNNQIDWRIELQKYVDSEMTIHTITCPTGSHDRVAQEFYAALSGKTNGANISFAQAGRITEVFEGIALAESGNEEILRGKYRKYKARGDKKMMETYSSIAATKRMVLDD